MAPDQSRPGAAELMRSLDLLVHGPRLWGARVPARGPGVFIAELPSAPNEAPLDHAALRRWLEHVPELTLDGQPPDARTLAGRLADFWLPEEPIVFIGRSSRSIGQRIAAMFVTPLGDAKPSSLGYWLKTLSSLPSVRIWWAETDAVEEYEDALFDEVAARNDGHVPFANLSSASRGVRRHGLANALRERDASTAKTVLQAPATTRARRTPTPAVRAASGRPPASRRPRTASAKATPPPAQPTYMSADGVAKLTAELQELQTTVRPEVIARVKAARELGDLRENGDYEAARKEQSFVEGRIQTLEALLRSSRVIDIAEPTDSVRMGSTVEVETDGERETYVLVGSSEANPAQGRLSYQSPVGQALLGARAGDEVTVELPRGSHHYRVLVVR